MPGCVVWSLVCATFSAAHFCGDPFSAEMIKERLPCDFVAGKLFVWRYLHCRCILFFSPNSAKNVRHATCVSAHPTMPSTNDLVLCEKCSQCTCGSVFSFSQHYYDCPANRRVLLPCSQLVTQKQRYPASYHCYCLYSGASVVNLFLSC